MRSVAVAVALVCAAMFLARNSGSSKMSSAATGKVRVEVFMEAHCPYSRDFMVLQLKPTALELGDFMDVKIIPFGKAHYKKLGLSNGSLDYSFECQHGPSECIMNQFIACGLNRLKRASTFRKVMFASCSMKKYIGETALMTCSKKSSLNHMELQKCALGKEGRKLHFLMGWKTKHMGQEHLTAVPWVRINGRHREVYTHDLQKYICAAISGIKPRACDLY